MPKIFLNPDEKQKKSAGMKHPNIYIKFEKKNK
jgi:hypothetical protein